MKRPFFLLAAFVFVASLSNAQLTVAKASPDTFRIQKFPFRVWFDGEKIRKPKQVESILLTKKDLQINRDWQTANTTRSIGTGVMVLGVVLEAVSLVKQVNGDEGGTNLLLGGAGLLLGGAIIQMFSKGPSERAIKRYNDLEMGRASLFLTSSQDTSKPPLNIGDRTEISEKTSVKKKYDPDAAGPRITFRTGLNVSKLWEIGGSDELRSDEKIWWAKSMPVALAYEMPGNTPGHAFTLELSLVSKGFRDKTETTTNGGTTKSRTDLQMRFLQIAGLKTLPLGPQDRKLRFHARGGAFIAYAASARWKSRIVLKDDDTKRWTRQITKIKFGSEFGQLNANRFDAGLMAGAGVSYPVGCGRVTFDAQFSFGAMNLEKTKSEEPELKPPSLHTRDLALMVGYSVPISR